MVKKKKTLTRAAEERKQAKSRKTVSGGRAKCARVSVARPACGGKDPPRKLKEASTTDK